MILTSIKYILFPGETALHIAASHNHAEMVEYLLSRGADINIQCKDGRTPLMYAAANNNR